MNLLTSMDICNVDEFIFLTRNKLVLKVYSRTGYIKINLLGLVCLNISNDDFGLDEDITIFEVNHDFRRVTDKDLQFYSFIYRENDFKKPMHIIKMHGSTIIDVICADVTIESIQE
jgi:hypothetical protein